MLLLYHTVNGHLRRRFPNPYRRSSSREKDQCVFEIHNHLADFNSIYAVGTEEKLDFRLRINCKKMDMEINAYLNHAKELINEDPAFRAEVIVPGNILCVRRAST